MRVLVDVTHPAHVHLFRPTIATLESRGHEVRVASREKDVTVGLLDGYGIDHTVLSRKRTGALGVAREWLGRELRLLSLARRFDPDVVLSRLNPASAHVSALLGVPNVIMHDTEVARGVDRVITPFAEVVCTPKSYQGNFGDHHLRYDGFHELAYLHPARFDPDPAVLRHAGVDPDEPYSVVRLVGMDAHHDTGSNGFSPETVRHLVDGLADHGSVYVTSENPLPADLAEYENPVPATGVHDLLSFADLYVGDSATMATEAALLGTPAVRFDPLDHEMGNFATLEEYGLVASSFDEREAVENALALVNDGDASHRWRRRRRRLLAEKIDVTAFLVELTEEVGEP